MEGTSESILGGLSYTESNDALASQTYCLRSIITIASAVRKTITANVAVIPASMFINSSSIKYI